jgi:hypothetical protein
MAKNWRDAGLGIFWTGGLVDTERRRRSARSERAYNGLALGEGRNSGREGFAERGAQHPPGAEQPAHDGSDGDVQRLGSLPVGQLA